MAWVRRGRRARGCGVGAARVRPARRVPASAPKRAKHARKQEVAAHARAPSHGPAAAPAHALLVQLFEKGLRFVIRQRPHSSWRTGEEKNQHAENLSDARQQNSEAHEFAAPQEPALLHIKGGCRIQWHPKWKVNRTACTQKMCTLFGGVCVSRSSARRCSAPARRTSAASCTARARDETRSRAILVPALPTHPSP
jgi:hypothetical protein